MILIHLDVDFDSAHSAELQKLVCTDGILSALRNLKYDYDNYQMNLRFEMKLESENLSNQHLSAISNLVRSFTEFDMAGAEEHVIKEKECDIPESTVNEPIKSSVPEVNEESKDEETAKEDEEKSSSEEIISSESLSLSSKGTDTVPGFISKMIQAYPGTPLGDISEKNLKSLTELFEAGIKLTKSNSNISWESIESIIGRQVAAYERRILSKIILTSTGEKRLLTFIKKHVNNYIALHKEEDSQDDFVVVNESSTDIDSHTDSLKEVPNPEESSSKDFVENRTEEAPVIESVDSAEDAVDKDLQEEIEKVDFSDFAKGNFSSNEGTGTVTRLMILLKENAKDDTSSLKEKFEHVLFYMNNVTCNNVSDGTISSWAQSLATDDTAFSTIPLEIRLPLSTFVQDFTEKYFTNRVQLFPFTTAIKGILTSQ